jgi:hypothetical protein
MPDITQEVVILNEAGFEERRRTTSRGTSSRYTVTIKSEPLLHQFDELVLGKGPAEAIRALLQKKIRGIDEFVSLATKRRRERAQSALARGVGTAPRRYGGGRMGRMEPNRTDRLFNDSERLADGVAVMENKVEESWTVNVAVNRLTPVDFGPLSAVLSMVERLQRLVPELGDARKMVNEPSVKKAIDQSIADLITKAKERGLALTSQRRGALLRLVGLGRLATLSEVTFP